MAASLMITPSFVLLGTYEALSEGNCVKWAARLLAKNVKRENIGPGWRLPPDKKAWPVSFPQSNSNACIPTET